MREKSARPCGREYYCLFVCLCIVVAGVSPSHAVDLSELPRGKVAALFSDTVPEKGTPAGFFNKTSCKGWDYDHRSIVVDLGKICLINEVRLEADGHSDIQPHVDNVALYVSLDNKQYTKVNAQFGLLPGSDSNVVWIGRFSGLDVCARYIKAHNGYGGTATGFFCQTDHADMVRVFSREPEFIPPRIEGLAIPSWLASGIVPAVLRVSCPEDIPVCLNTKVTHIATRLTRESDFQINTNESVISLDLSDLTPGDIEIVAELTLGDMSLVVDQMRFKRRLFEKIHHSLDPTTRTMSPNHAVLLCDIRDYYPYPPATPSKEYSTVWGQTGYLVRGNQPFAKSMVLSWPYQGRFAMTVGVTKQTHYLKASFGDNSQERVRFQTNCLADDDSTLGEIYLGTFRNHSSEDLRIKITPPPDGWLAYLKVEPHSLPSWLKPDGMGSKRVILDNDGFSVFYLGMCKNSAEMSDFTNLYRNTDIQGVIWCVGSLLEVNYQSKHAPMFFENCTDFGRPADRLVHDVVRDYAKNGEDTLDVAIRTARENNLFCWAGLRMNHTPHPVYTQGYQQPLYQAFQDYLIYETPDRRGNCVSYAFPEIRQHVISIFAELIDRNPDGILVELTRNPPFVGFHPELVAKYRKIKGLSLNQAIDPGDPLWSKLKCDPMTRLMRQLRNIAKLHEKQSGQKLAVAVHVTNSGMYADGIDLRQWVEENLIDVIVVGSAGLGGVSSKTFTDLVAGHDVLLYGHINAWFGGHDPTPEEEQAKARGDRVQKEGGATESDVYKQLAYDYYQGGFDGVYMWDAWMMMDLITELGDREALYQWFCYQKSADAESEPISLR